MKKKTIIIVSVIIGIGLIAGIYWYMFYPQQLRKSIVANFESPGDKEALEKALPEISTPDLIRINRLSANKARTAEQDQELQQIFNKYGFKGS